MGNKSSSSRPQLQQDRISKLPDDLLVVILSILSFKEAAQTSILSHRWTSLWTRVPKLHFVTTLDKSHVFKEEKRKRYTPVFANLVNRVLDFRGSSYLQEFKIVCELDKCNRNEIDKWLEYALGLGVETLELNLARCGFTDDSVDLYTFPNKLLHHLTNKFAVQLAPKDSFSRLRELCFIAVNISGEAIECLLFNCPLLEDLRVNFSMALVNVVVSGPSLSLKYLEITSCDFAKSITISNTNIVSVKVLTRPKGFRLILDNLPKLTKVWITGAFPEKNIFFSELSCCLVQLTNLMLQSFHPEDIMSLYKLPELHNLRRLVLISPWCSLKSVIGLTSLIESCPQLVEFALMLSPVDCEHTRSDEDQRPANEESLKSLKVFELYGFYGNYEYEDELIMFFIENALALEKIIIDQRDNYRSVPIEDKRSKKSRRRALEKYKRLIPKHVDLDIR